MFDPNNKTVAEETVEIIEIIETGDEMDDNEFSTDEFALEY